MSLISSFIPSGIATFSGSISTKSAIRTGNLAPARSTNGAMVIECSSRPQKKATAHHKKTRPRKTAPWDMKRKPTVYAPLPPLPPDWSFAPATEAPAEAAESGSAEAARALI